MANHAVIFKQYQPSGRPEPGCFATETIARPTEADLQPGQFLLKTAFVSADPYMSFRIRQAGGEGEFQGFTVGEPITGFIAGTVIAANDCKRVKVGDVMSGNGPYVQYQILKDGNKHLNVVNGVADDHLSYLIGVLGMPGCTAWGGVTRILEAQPGQVLFVSGAAGAVGSLVGQMAKAQGCKVIGSCGSAEKVAKAVNEWGFDAAFNYKECASKDDIVAKIKEAFPGGIDLYFDNVGGIHLQAAIEAMRPHGRIAICGVISRYDGGAPDLVPDIAFALLTKQLRIQGFMVFDWLADPKAIQLWIRDTRIWMRGGFLKVEESEFTDFEQGFLALFTGANVGKVTVKFPEE